MPKIKSKKKKNAINVDEITEEEDLYFKEESSVQSKNYLKNKTKKFKLKKKLFPGIYYITIPVILILLIIFFIIIINKLSEDEKVTIREKPKEKELSEEQKKELKDIKIKIKELEKEKTDKDLENNKIKNELLTIKNKIKEIFGPPGEGGEVDGGDKYRNFPETETSENIEPIDNKKLEEIEEYVNKCKNGELFEKKEEYFTKKNEPKISIIIPVHNKEKFIIGALRSIQNQSFKDIEIIFVDDDSIDKTKDTIREFQKEDQRIVLITNKMVKGTFYSLNAGSLEAKGEYIQFLDVEDYIVGDILGEAYQKAIERQLDIVQYLLFVKEKDKELKVINLKGKKKAVFQPELKEMMYYNKNYFTYNYFLLTDKLIKKSLFINSLKEIEKEYREEKLDIHENYLALYFILKNARFYYFIEKPGYYYSENLSYLNAGKSEKSYMVNKIFKSLFIQLKFFYKKTELNKEAIIHGYYLYYVIKKKYENLIDYLTDGFDFIIDVLELYISSRRYNIVLKESFSCFVEKIKQRKEKVRKLR